MPNLYFIIPKAAKRHQGDLCSSHTSKAEALQIACSTDEVYSMPVGSRRTGSFDIPTIRTTGTLVPNKKAVGRPKKDKEPWADRDGNPYFKVRLQPDLYRRIEAAGGSAYIRNLIDIDTHRWDSPLYVKPAPLADYSEGAK